MDFAAARRNMIDSQLRPNKVADAAVIEALASVPRELFAPEALRTVAYVDEDIPVGGGRFLMEPMILARLLQLAALRPTDAVLVVGAGVGYAAAVVGRLAGRVVAVESEPELAARAAELLRTLGVANAAVVQGQLTAGAPGFAPYDAIVFDGAVDLVPPAILDQLADGGRLVAVVHDGAIGRATLITRSGGVVSSRIAFDAAVPRLPGFEAPPRFVF